MFQLSFRHIVLGLVSFCFVGDSTRGGWGPCQESSQATSQRQDGKAAGEIAVKVQYLEIVTPAVQETCTALAKAHGVTFSDPIPELGNARTALLKDGGRLGVRAPLRATEQPVVRPYLLVEDIQAAVKAAEVAGGQVAIGPTEIPGHGTFAIYVLGGIDHGLWQQ